MFLAGFSICLIFCGFCLVVFSLQSHVVLNCLRLFCGSDRSKTSEVFKGSIHVMPICNSGLQCLVLTRIKLLYIAIQMFYVSKTIP